MATSNTTTARARKTAVAAAQDKTTTTGKKVIRTHNKIEHKRLASVPDKTYAESYVKRRLAPGISDYILFDWAMTNHTNVLIEGPTGCGKTSAIMAWAADREHHFYSVSSSIGLEPSQLFGKYIPDGNSANGIRWQDGPVTDLVRHGGVLLLNEVNFIPDRIGTILFSLLDKRREIQLVDHEGEVIKAHEDLVIFADMNPDYSGTHPLNAAFRNRFGIQQYWDYDERIEQKLVPYKTLTDLARKIRERVKTGEFETPVSTNMLFEFVRNYQYLGLDFALSNFVTHFNADERDPLGKILDTARNEIEKDLKPVKRLTPYGEPAYAKGIGTYGVDWGYEGDEDEDDEEATTEVADDAFDHAEAAGEGF